MICALAPFPTCSRRAPGRPVVGVLVSCEDGFRSDFDEPPVAIATDGQIEKRCRIICRVLGPLSHVTASGARTGLQLVNTSANRLHCQSVPSAALVGDVRLTDSNAATQANIAHAAISTATLWVLGWEIMALAPVLWPEQ